MGPQEKYMRFFTLCFLLILSIHSALALPLNEEQSTFNVKQANRQFDRINLQLSVQNLNLHDLNIAIKTLEDLITQADQCVDEAQKKLSGINEQILQANDSSGLNKESADLVYLTREQKKSADKKAQCRLFSIRAKEAVGAYKTASTELKQEEVMTRGLPVWSMLNQLLISPPDFSIFNTLSITLPPTLQSPFILIFMTGAAIFLSCAFLIKIRKVQLIQKYLRIRQLRISHILLLSAWIITGIVFIFCFDAFADTDPTNFLLETSRILCLYLLSLILLVLLFKIKKIKAFFYWYSLEQTFFEALLIVFVSFYALAILGKILIKLLTPQSLFVQFGQSCFLLVMLATAIYFIYYFGQAHKHLRFVRKHRTLIRNLCILPLLSCAILDMIGFHILAMRLTLSGFITFTIIFVTILIINGIHKVYLLLNQNQILNNKIIHIFGYKKEEDVFMEFLILKTTLQVVTLALSLFLIGLNWGFATSDIQNIYTQFLYSINMGNLVLYPTRIVVGIIIYCVVYLLFRSISTAISHHQQFDGEEETQVAIASILSYVGFGIALIAGLLIAGFNFTGLAIIAGALSVGIGLGLQSIVNNFVSGLILLIEKPIKPGDRINVDGVEGIVKKIRVRSTQIITPAREDIIVPNSDLITRRVTNYMYSDRYLSICCEVGVAYGSDTRLVQETLLEVANSHDEVAKTGRSKPTVLLRQFGDSHLIFQLWCLIKDANKKSVVKSDLNFAIEQIFREKNISMACPKRDIHISLADVKALLYDKDEH
jgi:potassium efflux system protein